ncbi:LytTR family DNA-binding domain-containing protein [Eubacterium sp. 1001713B170207_170306_E7]|uniref:LytR/AlgR family response regulator transcription factor n=1 Tax=Eubacterium sp. 1001713B170207_170306_E7 TaxID=2787097 RepID=UPI00189BEC78|nr:LytTR family DNA-binding domain-containing protein [Eubacterium sp. 1001713B170207_170306_E7]
MNQIAVCDDLKQDFYALKKLIQRFLYDYDLEYDIMGFETAEAFLEAYEPGKYAVIFLDMILPGMSGIDLAHHIRQREPQCQLIFTTVSSDYALDGYRAGALDYLLKPVCYQHLIEALTRCDFDAAPKMVPISLINDQGTTLIRAARILFAEIFGNHLMIHTNSTVMKTYLALSAFEQRLPPDTFVRVSRSHLVNMRAIVEIEGDSVLLVNGERVAVSRRRKKTVRQTFNDFLIRTGRLFPCG